MVVANMDGPMRNQVLKLIDEKKKIESEITELGYVLQRNKVGMEDSLVDGNGFPRNDIDVYQVRHARHRIICLQNDHKALMKAIEKGLHALHSSDHGAMDTSSPSSGTITGTQTAAASSPSSAVAESNGSQDCDSVTQSINTLKVSDPAVIAKINFVSGGSPAEEAGLRVNDEILEFGSLNVSNYTDLSQMGDIVRHSMNQRINLKIIRGPGHQLLEVPLTPRVWAGRGYLGCNIVPFNHPDL